MKFTFNSKETYLQYRTIWKQRYAALSQLIRDLKFTRKRFDTSWPKAAQDRYRRIQKENTSPYGFCPQGLCWRYRQDATAMLEELKLAKAEAQRQYQEKHLQVPANS